MDSQQVAIENTDILHRHTANTQQKIGVRLKHGRVHLVVAFNVLLR